MNLINSIKKKYKDIKYVYNLYRLNMSVEETILSLRNENTDCRVNYNSLMLSYKALKHQVEKENNKDILSTLNN